MPKRACRVRPLFTRQTSQLSRRCEEGRHRAPTAVTLAIEWWPTPKAVEVIFLKGEGLPISEMSPLRKMHRAGVCLHAPEGRGR